MARSLHLMSVQEIATPVNWDDEYLHLPKLDTKNVGMAINGSKMGRQEHHSISSVANLSAVRWHVI